MSNEYCRERNWQRVEDEAEAEPERREPKAGFRWSSSKTRT